MKSNSVKTVYLKDYQEPAYWVDKIDLKFDLSEQKTLVESSLVCRKNKQSIEQSPLILLGEKLILLSLELNGKALTPKEYQEEEGKLTIFNAPESFTLEIKTEIHPEENFELTGLYFTKSLFCTQCEAEGFRRITYFPDRPDVLSKFTTTIVADKNKFPVLLSNGNCVGKGDADNNRHWVKWEDPFLKPSYLFALVAGNLVSVEDHFVTQSGRLVTLKFFIERQNQDKCAHAIESLKKCMRWDEITYGREYDLDIYMIVAVNDFNMGAMENKGLNIFNSKYILARPETATDMDYRLIDDVVGHEYFHNWSGNRVTCRDWFQLSLKEGLTVFREHQFSKDISKSSVSLIENVRYLRSQQFTEDSGPMAHPIRPDAYIEINNFYTSTIYQKGAEVIGMIKTLLGEENFRRGMDLYFEKHDGQAVTTEDFVVAMEAASKIDLTQFRLWYKQAGTPEITLFEAYQDSTKEYKLTIKQYCPPTPGQPHKEPMVIPIAIGLLGSKGQELLPTQVLVLNQAEQTFTFKNISEKPILSFLRSFSAPVKVQGQWSNDELAFLLANDTDDFNRWEVGQRLSEKLIWKLVEDFKNNRPLEIDPLWLKAHRAIIENSNLNPALKAEILTLPSLSYLIELKNPTDLDALIAARNFCKTKLAQELKEAFLTLYEENVTTGQYQYLPHDVAARSLKNLALQYLMLNSDPNGTHMKLCLKQWENANNMTDSLAVLNALANSTSKERQIVLAQFYDKWKHDPLVMDKWLRIQALSESPETLENVKLLMNDPIFDIKNPNKVYSLIGAFCSGNLAQFHHKSGAGYQFLADMVLKLDLKNPLVAARMARAFTNWKRFDNERQALIRTQLQRLKSSPALSKDVFEIVTKCLEIDV